VLPGCILDQVTSGFTLRGRLLRPARVVVAAGSESEK
jgi:molecular chaperone GrpE (heat shock protein)